jgi:Pentapeptide repeats (8 copies)
VPRQEPREQNRRWVIVLGALGLFVLVLLYLSVAVLPKRVQPVPPLSVPTKDGKITPDAKILFDEAMTRVTAQNTVRTTLVQGIGAFLLLITAGIGGFFTLQQVKVSRETQFTERFAKAIEQLGEDTKSDLRIGAIHSLGRLATNSAFDAPAIAAVLGAFVRRRAPMATGTTSDGEERHEAQPHETLPDEATGESIDLRTEERPLSMRADDVQAALTVLGSSVFKDVVLSYVDAHIATLPGANFHGAVFDGANLADSYLPGAEFSKAWLTEAILHDADLEGADLQQATLHYANLRGANLQEAKLQNADLQGAILHQCGTPTSSGLGRRADARRSHHRVRCVNCRCLQATACPTPRSDRG